METMTIGEIAHLLGVPTQAEGRVTFVCTDSREAAPGALFVAIPGERVNGHDYILQALERGAVCALAQEPGDYPPQVLVVKSTLDALLAIGAYYRSKFAVRVVGITGSVGKTTTKDMVAAVVESALRTIKTQGNQNNEIGLPRTLFAMDHTTQAAVLEMGMSGPGEIRALAQAARPQMGIITNIGVSHLEHLGSRENILKAKLELADCLPDGAPLFLCKDNDLLAGVAIPRLRVIHYSLEDTTAPLYGRMTQSGMEETQFEIHWRGQSYPAKIPGTGRHLVLNALAAFGVGQELGIPPQDCIQALEQYIPSGMRQRVVHHRGVVVVEDCYNASPDSMAAAIAAAREFPNQGRKILVLSDMLELGEIGPQSHRQVGELAARSGVDLLLAWGPLAAEYAAGARAVGMGDARHFEEKQQLMAQLAALAEPGDLLWVKGSRGMMLEEVLQYFYTHYNRQ